MCSYIVEKAALIGSAKGRKGWMRIDTANVYFDHPYHSTLDHVLAIDFTNEGEGGRDRVAVELSADSARALVERILAALASGEAAHAAPAAAIAVARNNGYDGRRALAHAAGIDDSSGILFETLAQVGDLRLIGKEGAVIVRRLCKRRSAYSRLAAARRRVPTKSRSRSAARVQGAR